MLDLLTHPAPFPSAVTAGSAFIVGLMGGVHCAGMCGGIVSALGVSGPALQPAPITVVTHREALAATVVGGHEVSTPAVSRLALQLAYNTGRLLTYAFIGAIAGSVGAAALLADAVFPVQHMLYLLANLFLLALGAYLTGMFPMLAQVERIGGRLWSAFRPVLGRLLPVRSVGQGVLMGGLWGFVPCGLIYSMILSAMLAGSPLRGAAVMLAFGLGTLPNLLLLGLAMSRGGRWWRRPAVRVVAGLFVIAFGLLGLWRANAVVQQQGGWFCLTPATASGDVR
ncbi:sulfite exporter TauE/SafE family protein [Derxia gummosa]|uniref:Sulfite exporter TauE/SafE family protein n=1 Tax=Derxia gummosa DSM 723 TaxID=1121388 RepID=A0A8B6XAD9_9BURK|nr:sulfite exporter TauE/SafE family protein [Derxia gummosa]